MCPGARPNTVHLSTEPREPVSRGAVAWRPNIEILSVQALKWTVLGQDPSARTPETAHLVGSVQMKTSIPPDRDVSHGLDVPVC